MPRKFLPGVFTIILLSLIVVLANASLKTETTTAATQKPSTRQEFKIISKQLGLEEMVNHSERIFRGTVVDVEFGTVNVGGGNFSTVTYDIRVEQSFKGSFVSKNGVQYAEITMLSDFKGKRDERGKPHKMSMLPTLPLLDVGSDYLLLMPPVTSSVGLTSPVGLGQGCFKIYPRGKREMVRNELNNAGLFDGPVTYNELVEKIQQGGE